MSKVKVTAFSVSVDGFGAGPRQGVNNPLGVGGPQLHAWLRPTEAFNRAHGESGGTKGVDSDIAAESFENIGAWLMGRNMFGPVRGPWKDDSWRGWWGENPPFHTPVFVLTHHARAALTMEGGTTFYFVTGGPDSALKKAKEAAKDKDVRVGGGVAVLRHYLQAGQIDQLHLAVSPVLLGEGENVFSAMDLTRLGYGIFRVVAGEKAMHVFVKKS